MTEPKAHYRLTSIEGVRPKGTQRPSPEDLEVLRQQLEDAGVPRQKGNRPAMTEYTPTTEQVRSIFAGDSDWEHTGLPFERQVEFDRWLAEHDRQVAERAWDEGRRAQIAHINDWVAAQIPNSVDGGYSPLVNPYRKEATGD